MSDGTAIPEHVPPELVYDFDFYAVSGHGRPVQAAWLDLRRDAPGDIFWTPRHGGHWVALRADDIENVQMEYERFSQRDGTTLPVTDHQRRHPMLPLAADPPQSAPYRALIMPAFLPRAVNILSETVREVAARLVEALAPRGECEFVSAFARVLPVVVFLKMVDLPQDDRLMLQAMADEAQRSGSVERRQRSHEQMRAYVAGWVETRTASPGDDLISRVCTAEIDGRPITRGEAEGVCHLLVAGGLDTVASMIGFSAWHLAANPENRRKARESLDDPQRLRAVVEELIRAHGLVNSARTVTRDFTYRGVRLREGDKIMIPNALAGLDEARVDRPLDVDFDRPAPIYHAAFGNGPHTCPGATLARREMMIFLQEWLRRIPEFEVKPGTTPTDKSGLTNSMLELHLSWELGARENLREPGAAQ